MTILQNEFQDFSPQVQSTLGSERVNLIVYIFSFVLNSNLDGNNVTKELNSPTESKGLNKTKNDTKVDEENGKKLQRETKGCLHFERQQVVVQVPRNRTVCLERKLKNCTVPVVIVNRTKTVTTRFNICWDVTNKLRPMLFILGTGAILSNLVVITTVTWTRNLRRCSPFLLVSAMAFCDFLVGIYSFGIAFGHGLDTDAFKAWKNTHCSLFRSMFIFAEVVGSLTSLLMTIERYLAIVFCMRPSIRLGRKAIRISLVLFWIAGIAAAVLVQMLDTRNNQKTGNMCLIYRNSNKISTVYISELLLLFLVFAYLLVAMLYFHIFIAVRKSARNAGVLRESTLAKRIGAIVLTSFVFFAAPNFTLAWFIFSGGGVFEDAKTNRTLLWWLPPVCLVVNACLNPWLFAFKNDKFVRALRKLAGDPFARLLTLRSKKTARRDHAYIVDNSSLATSQCSLQRIELTLFSAGDHEEKDPDKI